MPYVIPGMFSDDGGGGGGSSLPSVTLDDEGKVLGVVNGSWDKMASGGGAGGYDLVVTLFINLPDDEDEPPSITADHTFQEVCAHKNSVLYKFIYGYTYQGEYYEEYYGCLEPTGSSDWESFIGLLGKSYIDADSDRENPPYYITSISEDYFMIYWNFFEGEDPEETLTYEMSMYGITKPELPYAEEVEDGSILVVENGRWIAGESPASGSIYNHIVTITTDYSGNDPEWTVDSNLFDVEAWLNQGLNVGFKHILLNKHGSADVCVESTTPVAGGEGILELRDKYISQDGLESTTYFEWSYDNEENVFTELITYPVVITQVIRNTKGVSTSWEATESLSNVLIDRTFASDDIKFIYRKMEYPISGSPTITSVKELNTYDIVSKYSNQNGKGIIFDLVKLTTELDNDTTTAAINAQMLEWKQPTGENEQFEIIADRSITLPESSGSSDGKGTEVIRIFHELDYTSGTLNEIWSAESSVRGSVDWSYIKSAIEDVYFRFEYYRWETGYDEDVVVLYADTEDIDITGLNRNEISILFTRNLEISQPFRNGESTWPLLNVKQYACVLHWGYDESEDEEFIYLVNCGYYEGINKHYIAYLTYDVSTNKYICSMNNGTIRNYILNGATVSILYGYSNNGYDYADIYNMTVVGGDVCGSCIQNKGTTMLYKALQFAETQSPSAVTYEVVLNQYNVTMNPPLE